MAGLFGSGPDQLSIGDIIAGLQPVGEVLAARGRKIGLPLGLGLTAAGGLAGAYTERQRAQAQRKGLADALMKLQGGSSLQDVMPSATAAGVDPKELFSAYTTLHPEAKPDQLTEAWNLYQKDPKGFAQFEEAAHPKQDKQSSWSLINEPGVAPYWANRATGETRPAPNLPTRPVTSAATINIERPIGPGDILRDDAGKPVGVLEVDKSGNLSMKPAPAGVPTVKPKGKGEATGTALRKTKFSGYNYEVSNPKGDPNNGVARLTDSTWRSVPKFIWVVNGRPRDPSTMPPGEAAAFMKAMIAKGMTKEQLLPE